MFRLLFGGKQKTFKPLKKHVPGSKREQYSCFTLKTLGSGDTKTAVKLPDGEDLNEWIAANTVEFFNELSLIWGIICDIGSSTYQPGEGFPHGFEYLWSGVTNNNNNPSSRGGGSNVSKKSPSICSGPQYVEYVLDWVDEEINNGILFPTSPSIPFPKHFNQSVKVIYTRLFRIFAIIYSHHFLPLEELGAVTHLNTSFKHFMFFVWEYDLVVKAEQEALQDIIYELKARYTSNEYK